MSDLKEKIKQLISDVEIDSGEDAGYVSLNRESVIEVSSSINALFDTHAAERAVEFAKWCDTEGFFPTKDNKWQSAEYPWIRHSDRTDAELYALFDEETKTK